TILDVLRLVGDDRIEPDAGEKRLVAGQRSIAGDDQSICFRFHGMFQPMLGMMDEGSEGGRKSRGLAAPVFQETGGRDDQAGCAGLALVALSRVEQREGLQRFAEAHLIGENPTEPKSS